MYLIDDGSGAPIPVHARLRNHLSARLNADHIDLALAGGAPPDACITSVLRSRALTSERSRRTLAHGLRRAMTRANDPWAASSTGVRVNRAQILSAEPEIAKLHHLLLAGGPVSSRGVAQLRLLLTTGSGQLYNPRTAAHLGPYLRRTIEAMNVLAVSSRCRVRQANFALPEQQGSAPIGRYACSQRLQRPAGGSPRRVCRGG